MRRQSFDDLRHHLLESGITPGHVRRIIGELGDHLDDLRAEAIDNGMSRAEARAFAQQRIGEQKLIAERIVENAEFRTWVYRYPRIARLYLPVAYTLLLPAAPVFAGLANPKPVMRWGASLMLSFAVTTAMLLFMGLSIALT